MPKVSIIMASYNHEKFVHEAIQSVLNQSFQDVELIIVDDASTDNTVNKIKNFSDTRLKLTVLPTNQGQFVATNLGLKQAKGEYIGILNSDDAFSIHKLEEQVSFLDSNPHIGAVFSDAELIDEQSQPFLNKKHPYYGVFNTSNKTRFEWLNYFFHHGNCICHPSVLIRSRCHQELGYYDPRFANCADFQFWIRLTAKYDIHIIPKKLIQFRILEKEGNMSGGSLASQKRLRWEDYQAKLLFFDNLLSENDFFMAFPETKKFVPKQHESPLTAYLLARLALEKNDPYFDALGLRALFEMMENNETAERLKKYYDFSYNDLILLTGKTNPFQITLSKNKKIIHRIIQKIFWPKRCY